MDVLGQGRAVRSIGEFEVSGEYMWSGFVGPDEVAVAAAAAAGAAGVGVEVGVGMGGDGGECDGCWERRVENRVGLSGPAAAGAEKAAGLEFVPFVDGLAMGGC